MSETAGIPVVAAPVHARAVCFTGDNIDEVRAVVFASFNGMSELPDGYELAIGWPEPSNPGAVRLWDFRSTRWVYAMPSEWIIVFDTGVLVLDPWWYRTLFPRTGGSPDRLSHAAELATQLQQLLAGPQQEQPAAATVSDPFSALNLRQVPQHYDGPAMPVPVVGDIWRDASGKTWTVRHVPEDEWWTAECVDEAGLTWMWQVLWQYYSPLTGIRRVSAAA